jgi:NAD(P)-dependent dehydrogenase (short-subunit alcohol dehydrogenase family)
MLSRLPRLNCVVSFAFMHTQCGQAVGRQMKEQNRVREGRGGAIINMSSVNGITAIPSIAGYNSSKGGVDNLTRYSGGS